jgi:hypothetical protein
MLKNKFFLTLARTIDHRVGLTDEEHPIVPVLPVKYALMSFFIKFTIFLVNFITCGFVIVNIIHHW